MQQTHMGFIVIPNPENVSFNSLTRNMTVLYQSSSQTGSRVRIQNSALLSSRSAQKFMELRRKQVTLWKMQGRYDRSDVLLSLS